MIVPIRIESNNITYWIFFPPYPVSLFVDHFVVMKGYPSANEERIFPNNKMEIFFNLGESLEGRVNKTSHIFLLKESVISGIRNTYLNFKPGPFFFMAGLRFSLFGFYHLFGIPAHEFKNHNFDTKDIWGYEMELVREQLLEAPDLQNLIRKLYRWISDKLSDTEVQDAEKWMQVAHKLQNLPLRIKPFLADVMGYSHKHSVQLIKDKSGLPPKTIQQICRFEAVLHLIGKDNNLHWMDFVSMAGYADQSHMIREFRQFTGLTPAEYVLMKPKTYQFYQKVEEEEFAKRVR